MAACQSNQSDISDIKDVVVKTDTVAKKDSVEVTRFQASMNCHYNKKHCCTTYRKLLYAEEILCGINTINTT